MHLYEFSTTSRSLLIYLACYSEIFAKPCNPLTGHHHHYHNFLLDIFVWSAHVL